MKIILSAAVIPRYWTWPCFTACISLYHDTLSESESHIIQKFIDTVKIILFSTNVQLPALPYTLHERPYELCMLQLYSDRIYLWLKTCLLPKVISSAEAAVNAEELNISIYYHISVHTAFGQQEDILECYTYYPHNYCIYPKYDNFSLIQHMQNDRQVISTHRSTHKCGQEHTSTKHV